MKKILVLLALIALLSIADCRVPKVGDYVLIDSGSETTTTGTIKDISNGFICLNVTASEKALGSWLNFTEDACFGIGSIRILEWPGTSVTTINGK